MLSFCDASNEYAVLKVTFWKLKLLQNEMYHKSLKNYN